MSVSSAGHQPGPLPVSFEIKSAQLPLVSLLLKSNDWERLAADLRQQFGVAGESPEFFDHDALMIDFSHLPINTQEPDWTDLLALLRSCGMVPVALRGASAAWTEAALALGLVETPAAVPRGRPSVALPVLTQVVLPEELKPVAPELAHESRGSAALVVDKPVRSGQKIYARGTDLVLLAMVNAGAEVVADGNIHVYAPLRGKAMAGASGNTQARIFSLCLEPELVSIAGVYRTSESPLPTEVYAKAAQVRLSDDGQDKLLFEALNP